jgi:hypothetical protein
MLERFLQQSKHLSNDQFLQVAFRDFARNNTETISKVLTWAGLRSDAEIHQKFESHAKANPREGANKMQYDLSAFGLDESAVKTLFAFYDDTLK